MTTRFRSWFRDFWAWATFIGDEPVSPVWQPHY